MQEIELPVSISMFNNIPSIYTSTVYGAKIDKRFVFKE